MLASGPRTAEVMLVGEAPGANEVQRGQPFVGLAGKLLDNDLLPYAGLQRSEVYVTNVVLHRPPDNRDPREEEIMACRPWLEIQMEMVSPRVVVLLGRYAIEAFLGISYPMKDVAGTFVRKDGRLYMLSLHPAAALHQPSNKTRLIEGFEGLGRVLETLKKKEEAYEGQLQQAVP